MEWNVGVILLLAATGLGGIIFIARLAMIIEALKLENSKLELDLYYERKKK